MSEGETSIILWADARWCSPWVLSAWVALTEKGVPFQVQELDLESGQHKKGDYARQTVTGKVPAITHGDYWIAESLAIVEYVDEAFAGPPLLPKDPIERAQDRQVMAYIRSDFAELRRCMPFEGIFLTGRTPAITDEARDQCRRLMDLVDWRLLTRGKSDLTIADYELAAMLRRPIHYKGPITPEARAYSNAIWKRDSVKSWLKHDRSRFSLAEPEPVKKAAYRARAKKKAKAPKK